MSFFLDVPAGKIAAVVTSLEMNARPALRAEQPDTKLTLHHVAKPDLAWYRNLFRRVGEDWIWFSRLQMDDAALAAIIHDPQIEVHVLKSGADEAGLLELDFRKPGECELGYFGLAPPFVGTGAGRWLMNRAIDRAWSRPIDRFWLHTSTFDHPKALRVYQQAGFIVYARRTARFEDPRALGILPPTAGRKLKAPTA